MRKKLRSLKKKFGKFEDFDEKRARRQLEDVSKKAVDDAINRFLKVSRKKKSIFKQTLVVS